MRSGRWRAICRGVVLMGNGRLTRDQQLWVAVLATGPGAVLAGPTAAAEAGVRGLRREPLHVLVPAHRRAGRTVLGRLPIDMPAVVVHRASKLPPAHLQLARPPRTTTARALVDAAAPSTRRRRRWRPAVSSDGSRRRSCRRCWTRCPGPVGGR
ncbi:hypothetical protein [Micromonospora sp. NPDC007220]|uniref:hypothetical protein n=1 Tax=Micromonospora sp. NPDC007220 TaxID=3154318 RepID=UPI0033E557B5